MKSCDGKTRRTLGWGKMCDGWVQNHIFLGMLINQISATKYSSSTFHLGLSYKKWKLRKVHRSANRWKPSRLPKWKQKRFQKTSKKILFVTIWRISSGRSHQMQYGKKFWTWRRRGEKMERKVIYTKLRWTRPVASAAGHFHAISFAAGK